jgi:hypothetical protein
MLALSEVYNQLRHVFLKVYSWSIDGEARHTDTDRER